MLQHPCTHQRWDMNYEQVYELGMEGCIQGKWPRNLHLVAQKFDVPSPGSAFELCLPDSVYPALTDRIMTKT